MNSQLVVDLLENKFAVTPYLKSLPITSVPSADVIDVSGAMLASNEWAELCRDLDTPRGVVWRVLLLAPDSRAARWRAAESSVWRGDVDALNSAIIDRSAAIAALAQEIGVSLDMRYRHDSVSVTRYMRFDEVVLESYYPSNSTGRDTPIAILPGTSVLADRARKEFAVAWECATVKLSRHEEAEPISQL